MGKAMKQVVLNQDNEGQITYSFSILGQNLASYLAQTFIKYPNHKYKYKYP